MPRLQFLAQCLFVPLFGLVLVCASLSLFMEGETVAVANASIETESSVSGEAFGPDESPRTDEGGSNAGRKPELGEVVEIVICGECNKEVELTAKHGQKCPHCGIEWAIPVAIPKVGNRPASPSSTDSGDATSTEPSLDNHQVHGNVPRGNANPGNAGGNAAAPNAPRQLEVPNVPAPNMNQMQEMDLANIPLWMKAALFLGAIAMLYYMFFVR
jgi:hypothetical protein